MTASAVAVAIACVVLAGACVLAACASAAGGGGAADAEHARALAFVRGEARYEGTLAPRGEVWLDLGAVVRGSRVELEVFTDEQLRPRVELRDATRRVHWDGKTLDVAPGTALFARVWSRDREDAGPFRVVVRVVPPAPPPKPVDPHAIDVPPPPTLPAVPARTFECTPTIADCNRPLPCSTPGIPPGWPCIGSRPSTTP